MNNQEMKSVLCCDMLSKKRNGNYIARWGYFYTSGRTTEKYMSQVQEKLPNAKIVDSGNHWAPFKGGAPIQRQSHFYVEFSL